MEPESVPNIAAVLTPPGVGAIAVVRLAGPGVDPFLATCFSRPAIAGRCVHGELRDEANVIDDPVVVLASGSQSVDINLHGGAWVVQAALHLAQRHGFSIVDAANAPLPDFALDADNELEREILAYLPLASTETAVRVLLAQSAAWQRLEDPRVAVAPKGHFFSTDANSENSTRPTNIDIHRILSDRSLHWLLHPPRVAIVGIPNAGKSTLANQLFGQQRSITADLPGTTRDWVGETANLDGLAVKLLDTPGIRATNDVIESEAIARAGVQVNSADAVVLVLDATRLADPMQMELLQRFPDAIRVLNKTDAGIESRFDETAIPIVATTGCGIDQLRSAIRGRFDCEPVDFSTPRCWTDRQRQLLRLRLGGTAAL
jgi:tRNA modification GTPase